MCFNIFLLALALLQSAPPNLRATWAGPGSARISWEGSADLTCLYKDTTLIRCWRDLDDGPHALALGGVGPLDAKARPGPGSVFTLVQDERETQAGLRWALALPLMTR